MGVFCCNSKLVISVINYTSSGPLKIAADYPSSRFHNVYPSEKNAEKTTTKALQLIGSNESEHPLILCYYIFLIFLSWFCSKTHWSDVSVQLSFEASPWKQSGGCGWSLRAAPELFFEEETTEPQIMLHSPLVWTEIIRFFTLRDSWQSPSSLVLSRRLRKRCVALKLWTQGKSSHIFVWMIANMCVIVRRKY